MHPQPYDLIGDIHGHAAELESLLQELGYRRKSGIYRHPQQRKVIFLGDYIDRGPEIRRVLKVVRSMVESGEALAILGNHEVNALRYHARDADGRPLRAHSDKNRAQHQATLDQLVKPYPEEWADTMNWFSELPLWLDLGPLRAVHAAWSDRAVAAMAGIGPLRGGVLERFSRKGTLDHDLISHLINGPEALLPTGHGHRTADGKMRREIRVKWWRDLKGATCRKAIYPENPDMPALPPENLPETGYPDSAPVTFFGHYAVPETEPRPVPDQLRDFVGVVPVVPCGMRRIQACQSLYE